MPVSYAWDDETHTVMRIDFVTPWQWDEFYLAMSEAQALLTQLSSRYDMIMYNHTSNLYFPSGNVFSSIMNRMRSNPLSGVLMVHVNTNAMAKKVIGILTRLNPKAGKMIRFADSLEEARTIIAADRAGEKAQSAR